MSTSPRDPSELLTANERIQAAHILRGLEEHMSQTIKALSPRTGMAEMSHAQFEEFTSMVLRNFRHLSRRYGTGPKPDQEVGW